MTKTGANEIIVIAFRALSPDEQDLVAREINELVARRRRQAESKTEIALDSMGRVRAFLDETPTVDGYRQAWRQLRSRGEDVLSVNQIISQFGSWRQAKEALELSATNSPAQLESRLANRRLDKIWRYTEKTLRQSLARCVDELGDVPQVAEYQHWRRARLSLAEKKGDAMLHLPSASPFRRRYGSWERALLALGYRPDQVAERLERQRLS